MKTTRLVAVIALWLTIIAAWFTHIIHCLIAGKYLLLIAGAFIVPVGIIHGVGLWFGVQW